MKHNLVAEFGPVSKITKEQVYTVVYNDLVSIDMLDTKLFPDVTTLRKAVESRSFDFNVNNYAEDVIDLTVPTTDTNRTHKSIFNINFSLFKTPKWSKIKELQKWEYDVKYEHFVSCNVREDGILFYKYPSFALPYIDGTNSAYKRDEDDIKAIPDCFDCSYNSTINCDYRPWVIKKRIYSEKSLTPKWDCISQKVYFDIDEVKPIYDFETQEIIRCIKVAKTLKTEYNDAVRESRKLLNEVNKLRKEANMKSKEAKQKLIDVKIKINKTLIRKSELEGDF